MNRPWLFDLLWSAALLVSVGVAVSVGTVSLGLTDAWGAILHGLTGGRLWDPDPLIHDVVWQLRLPRILLAGVVGGSLSIIGVAMQTLVRNPLAEPYILGISSGASAGAALFYLGFLPPLVSRALTMPLAAFVGALATITLVYLLARKGPVLSTARLLLAGVALSAFLASITTFVTFASPEPNKMRAVLFWLLGSFSGTSWTDLVAPTGASVLGLAVLLAVARPMDALLVGEEPARSLGISVELLKRILILVAAVVTGAAVAASGIIGFVGLIVPHAVRFVVGVSHRTLLRGSFLVGAVFLIWADVAARTVLPAQELPVGVLTALCGVPFFLVLLRRNPSGFGGP